MAKLIVGAQQKSLGAGTMLARSTSSTGITIGAIPVGNPYVGPSMPGSHGGVAPLGGTEATNVRLTKNGQIY